MITKTINYKNFNNEDVTETAYFHMSTPEALRLESSKRGGLSKYLQTISDAQDTGAMLRFFEQLIEKSYGFKSDDGNKFLKDAKKTQEFMDSEAYSAFLLELIQSPDELTAFITALMPQVNDGSTETPMPLPTPEPEPEPDPEPEPPTEETH